MKKLLIASAALALLSAPAFAGSNGHGQGSGLGNLKLVGSYGKFSSNHAGASLTNGSVMNGNQGGTASYGGLSQVATPTNSQLQYSYGHPVRDAAGNPVVISNPATCGCAAMTGTSGSEVAGTSYVNSANANGLSGGYNNSSSWSAGSATGLSLGGSIGGSSSYRR